MIYTENYLRKYGMSEPAEEWDDQNCILRIMMLYTQSTTCFRGEVFGRCE